MPRLEAFPPEVFMRIIECLVATIGVYKVVRVRLVNKAFNDSVQSAICNPQVIDIFDPAAPRLPVQIPIALKGMVLLRKSYAPTTLLGQDPALFAIASVNQALDVLTQPTDEERTKQHRLIAEEVALRYRYSSYGLTSGVAACGPTEQMVFCGAIILGNLPLVEELLERRQPPLPSVNDWVPYFGRPLPLAAAWGHVDIVRYLLSRGANPRAVNANEWTGEDGEGYEWEPYIYLYVGYKHIHRHPEVIPLGVAALGGHEDIVNLLLQPEHRPSTLKKEYFLAMVLAAKGGHIRLLHLLDSILVESTGKSWPGYPGVGEVMLWEASRHGHEDIVNILAENGVDLNADPGPYFTSSGPALRNAAAEGNVSMARLLLDLGANPDYSIPSTPCPVEAAASRGHEDVLELIISRSKCPTPESNASMALRDASRHGQAHIVRWLVGRYPDLLERPLNPGAVSTLGRQAMELAVHSKNLTVISALVDLGVPLNCGDAEVSYPVITAKEVAAQWVVDHLLKLGADDHDFVWNVRCGTDLIEGDELCQPQRGSIYVSRRTWQWVGKY
ncbi:uncharacterized protein DNG_06277 [Cephalotrichum gorgonifer]|uniref:Uncharacterized protein n=1 Tax=Cephalotrichum gorgonifer TaxID=2041049 RepID=A0AAE8N1D0_9PEZI|nr:uncharacterized protein DNG_06277 [Cephalotrichum gorgonifer]